MTELVLFFVVLFAGLFFSELFNRLHLPWVVALIVAGVVIGPSGFGWYETNTTIEFLGQIGLVFLMFMAGLETRLGDFKRNWKGIEKLAFLNGLIPFAIGFSIGNLFGYDLLVSAFLGVIFISSSIAVVIPSLEANHLLHTRVGKSIIAATIFEDVASLLLLSIIFQSVEPMARLPLPIFYLLLIVILIILRWAIPRIRWFFSYRSKHERDIFQQELRSIFVILIGTVIMFEILGLHPIIAGFFAGMVLSDSINSRILKDKLHAFSYGLFIPFFFILVGAKADFSVFFSQSVGLLALVIALGSVISKFFSGWLGGRLSHFSYKESALIGAATIPHLSTALAVAFTGFEQSLIPQDLVTSLIFLAIITTFIAPILIRYVARKRAEQAVSS